MKMINAFTREIDDVELAVSEILEQLDMDNNLMSNSAGILTGFSEYIDSGVVQAVCQRLPFDVVGCTTLGNCVNGESDTMMLCLSVLTGDDISFSTAYSPSMDADNLKDALHDTYHSALGKLTDGSPKLAMTFLPMMQTIGGADMIAHLDKVSDGLPLFGTICCDHNTYQTSYTICNGQVSRTAASILLLSGNVSPKFHFASIPESKVQKQKAIITSSEGNVLKEVNNMPILKYMETLGLSEGSGIEAASSIPFVIDYNDGTQPSVCAIYLVMDNGYLSCGAPVPEGSTLAIGSLDYHDVLESTEEIVSTAMKDTDAQAALMFPCISRNFVLEADIMAEMEKIQSLLAPVLPFHMSYSGGEICPVYNEQRQITNRFHNFTIPICIL